MRIDDPSVSRQHAVLRVGDTLEIEDLGGANGTFVRETARGRRRARRLNVRQLVRRKADAGGRRLHPVRDRQRRRAPRPTVELRCPISAARPIRDGGVVVRDPGDARPLRAGGARGARPHISVLVLGETGVGKEVLARAIHAHSPRARRPLRRAQLRRARRVAARERAVRPREGRVHRRRRSPSRGCSRPPTAARVFLDEIGELPLGDAGQAAARARGARGDAPRRRRAARRSTCASSPRPTATSRPTVGERPLPPGPLLPAQRHRARRSRRCASGPQEIEPLAQPLPRGGVPQTGPADAARAVARPRCDAAPRPRLAGQRARAAQRDRARGRAVRRRRDPARAPAAVAAQGRRRARTARPLRRRRPPRCRRPPSSGVGPLQSEIDALEKAQILDALDRCGGNQSRAARMLGISRGKLIARLDSFGITRPRKNGAPPEA